jgi:pimeloyl-ACP methyl ester carboxylesterase
MTTLETVTSKDGTTITFERLGAGSPVVLVCGGSVDRMANAGLAALLASDFTVFNFDRRGRGESGDTPPYAVGREIEDIDAVIDVAGGSAGLYGISSGPALALEAARQLGAKVTRLALFEPPYIVDPAARPPTDQVEQYNTMIAEGRRGDAADYFMEKVVGLPAEFVAQARSSPWRAGQEALAHTLAYDATIMGDYSVPTETAAEVAQPTIVIDGSASLPFMHETAQTLAAALPQGRSRTLEGQRHDVDEAVLAPVLKEFFADGVHLIRSLRAEPRTAIETNVLLVALIDVRMPP